MKYVLEIQWGRDCEDQQKMILRTLLQNVLKHINVMPCWGETIMKGSKTKLFVNKHKIYTHGANSAMPSEEKLQHAILSYNSYPAQRTYFRNAVSISSALFIALFPKCPVCWATYMSIFGLAGSFKLPYTPSIFYMLIGIAILNLTYSYIKLRSSGNYLPIYLQIAGYLLILINRSFFSEPALIWTGILLLFSSSFVMHFKREKFLALIK